MPNNRKLTGDLFYLTVKTLEGVEKGITASVNGFFLNENNEKGSFSPDISEKQPHQAYTLVALLN